MNQLFPLLTGFLEWVDPPSKTPRWHPVYAYLVRTTNGRKLLIDTGNPRSLIGRNRADPWFDSGVSMRPEHDLSHCLDRANTALQDIDVLISTHFDFDHCGNHKLFDNWGIVHLVQTALLDTSADQAGQNRELWDRPGFNVRAVTGDAEIEKGVWVVSTPGHAAGHQSIMVELNTGMVVLAIDAMSTLEALGDGPLPWFAVDDRSTWLASRERLLDLVKANDAALIFGHEPGQLSFQSDPSQSLIVTDELRQSASPNLNAR
jgi:N-acyl homoserine lactone hydrolase